MGQQVSTGLFSKLAGGVILSVAKPCGFDAGTNATVSRGKTSQLQASFQQGFTHRL